MPDFDAKAYVEAMEQLGYIVRAFGERWYWGGRAGVSPSPRLLELQKAVNVSEENCCRSWSRAGVPTSPTFEQIANSPDAPFA